LGEQGSYRGSGAHAAGEETVEVREEEAGRREDKDEEDGIFYTKEPGRMRLRRSCWVKKATVQAQAHS
jgi:hypothetical protein